MAKSEIYTLELYSGYLPSLQCGLVRTKSVLRSSIYVPYQVTVNISYRTVQTGEQAQTRSCYGYYPKRKSVEFRNTILFLTSSVVYA
jgi:hypothetical protein